MIEAYRETVVKTEKVPISVDGGVGGAVQSCYDHFCVSRREKGIVESHYLVRWRNDDSNVFHELAIRISEAKVVQEFTGTRGYLLRQLKEDIDANDS